MPGRGSRNVFAWGAAVGLARLAVRYAAGAAEAERCGRAYLAAKLRNIGEVDSVTVLPLVERLTASGDLTGEAGVSYLVEAGGRRVLFDCGLSGGRVSSALVGNAERLGVDLDALDSVVISHLHADHVGGVQAVRHGTFAFGKGHREPAGIPAYTPVPMAHLRAEVVPTTGPRILGAGMALLAPLPRALFWLGTVAEQALVVNVRGFGLVLVSGCGHPPIERVLAGAEQVLDVPIAAVVGGLHLPVHPLGTPLVPQAVLGNPHWPWQPIGERDVAVVLEEIEARGPRLVALSGHDSTPWTMAAFGDRFGSRYRPLEVGTRLHIDAAGVR